MKIAISQIKIENRFRQDYGDIDSLAKSIKEIGQLQPIGIDSNYRLIFGERRIKACRLLGLDTIEGNVIYLDNILIGEFAENEFSEGWKISERVAILKAIETHQHGGDRKNQEQNFAVDKTTAAKKAGLGNKETARQAINVIDHGIPELVEKMDSGKVSVSAAADIATQSKEVQVEIVARGEKEILEAAKNIRAEKYKKKEEQREALRQENRNKILMADNPEKLSGVYSTIVIDPPWDWGDEGDKDQLGRAKPDYHTMTIDELLDLPVNNLSDDNAHIYLWITNRSLPKGFQLLDRWGFRYITALTWVKPYFGMGNYFRGQTEQVLFGVKGSLPLKRKDQGTVFHAERGPNGHSSKPVEFYDLVESCSPGPYLEMFSRANRNDWTHWGENSNAA